MLKINVRAQAKCTKHPRYDPSREHVYGIRGNCAGCLEILAIYDSMKSLSAGLQKISSNLVEAKILIGKAR